MALLDFLKNKEEAKKSKIKKSSASVKKSGGTKPEKVSVEKKSEKSNQSFPKSFDSKKKILGFSYNIIKEPHISEKSTYLSEGNQYTFRVDGKSNKSEIKKSVEGVYGVSVLSVNIVKIPAKKRRVGRTEGYKKGYTKAVVKIAEGQKIEIL